jgi:hypothetical protein
MRRLLRLTLLAALVPSLLLYAALPSAAGDSSADDNARILAGIEPRADSPLAGLTREAGWRQHARSFDAAWERLEARQLSKIRIWSTKNITRPQQTMLYMFSGPDFLYADVFFPNAATYVLSGLEPVGGIPDLSRLRRGSLSGALAHIRSSLGSVMNYSFFITKQMKGQLRSGELIGTLPLLYVFLARSGKTIIDVTLITLDKDGVELSSRETLPTGATGVKIAFTGSDGQPRTLYYFSTDLSDGGVSNSGFLKFCERLGAADNFIKSASYLLHSGNFSKIRDFVLAQSATVLQDDSGIPVHYFTPGQWELRPFGHYVGPIRIFAGRYQSRLSNLFRRAPPIDFGVGYRWRLRESNLLLAEKTEQLKAVAR